MRPEGRPRSGGASGAGVAATDLVELGRIVNHHGIRGEVRLLPHNPETTILGRVAAVTLRAADGRVERRRLIGSRRHKRFILLRFEGCESADAATPLIGRAVCVPRAELPPLGTGEYYHLELIGCAVRTDAGRPLGTIAEVLSTNSNDVCVVRDGDHEVLIPLIDDILVEVDSARREMVVRAIPGLLDP